MIDPAAGLEHGADCQPCNSLLWERSPARLWSRWELMQKFDVGTCAFVFTHLIQLAQIASTDEPKKDVPPEIRARINATLIAAAGVAFPAGLEQTAQMLLRLQNEFQISMNCGDVFHSLHNLQALMRSELEQQLFLQVDGRDAAFYEKERLFGDHVYDAFPSARDDIKEAGSCLATTRGTACIFHLMRVAEIGLRVLAWDRRVRFVKRPHVPLELRQRDEILVQLENSETEIQQYKQSLAREAQLAFYHGAMVELRAFKNLYRHRTAHAREIYDVDQARSAMTHVSAFMRVLASKISEAKRTPKIWKKANI
jgi:hypothetical protein